MCDGCQRHPKPGSALGGLQVVGTWGRHQRPVQQQDDRASWHTEHKFAAERFQKTHTAKIQIILVHKHRKTENFPDLLQGPGEGGPNPPFLGGPGPPRFPIHPCWGGGDTLSPGRPSCCLRDLYAVGQEDD